MFIQKLLMLCNVTVVKIANAKIEQNVEEQRKVKYGKIKAIILRTYNILHTSVDTKYPEGFDKKIQG